jgi:hypothetical protein
MAALLASVATAAQTDAPPPIDKTLCPQTIDCMPVLDKDRAERCAWVKEHCPETKILQ